MEKYLKGLGRTKMQINKEMILMEKENINHSELSDDKRYIALGNLMESISQLQFKFFKINEKLKDEQKK